MGSTMNRTLLLPAVLLLAAPGAALAQADAQTASYSKRLREADTPEQRAQAAQRLGESEDPEAVPALCAALEDSEAMVRAAAAHALQKLEQLEALECLRARREEPDEQVQGALKQALGALEKLAARPAKVQVLFGGVEDTTGSLSLEWVSATSARIRRRLVQVGAQLAPEQEKQGAAKGTARKRKPRQKLKAFQVKVEVRPGDEGGLKLSLLCLRHPGKQLQGTVTVQASGDEPPELLKVLAPAIVNEAVDTFGWGK